MVGVMDVCFAKWTYGLGKFVLSILCLYEYNIGDLLIRNCANIRLISRGNVSSISFISGAMVLSNFSCFLISGDMS